VHSIALDWLTSADLADDDVAEAVRIARRRLELLDTLPVGPLTGFEFADGYPDGGRATSLGIRVKTSGAAGVGAERPLRHEIPGIHQPRLLRAWPSACCTSAAVFGVRRADAAEAAFCTSAAILASPAAVSSARAKAIGHMAPSSRFAALPVVLEARC
jgi:hypothetical protein